MDEHRIAMNISGNSSSPPATMGAKLTYYRRECGLLHGLAGYGERYSPSVWALIGPFVTRPYLRRWVENSTSRIINLGGGSRCLNGCLTADLDARADAYVNITKQLPFVSASIHGIFCEEVIEHVEFASGRRLLDECCRVLVPGGVPHKPFGRTSTYLAQTEGSAALAI